MSFISLPVNAVKTSPAIIDDGRTLLRQELARRCEKNRGYSLRAFARALGVSHTYLSLVLAGKRKVTSRLAATLVEALSLGPDQARALTRKARAKATPASVAFPAHQVSLDTFALISDWYHYAILSLLELPGSRFEPKWIAARLGISEVQAKLAMECLSRLGLVEERGGRVRQAGKPIKIENTVSTAASRKFHKQILEKALESLENDPMDVRDFSAMTFAMDPAQVPQALKRIRAFRRSLMQELEAEGTPRRVYKLSVQLFPVSK
jgi:uncharacterized protein (TIGR02147 family)